MSILRMTKPWKVVAVVMAVFGFVSGYAAAVGGPFCGSVGQCVRRVVDAGPPYFYLDALIPGAIAAALLATAVYVVFLVVYGIRAAVGRPPAARIDQERTAERRLRAEPPEAPTSVEPPAAKPHAEQSPAPVGPRRWSRPTPLVIAIGAALAWAVLSVGPATLAADLDQVIPHDTVTAPSCWGQPPREDGLCASTREWLPPASCIGILSNGGFNWDCVAPNGPQVVLTKPECYGPNPLGASFGSTPSLEADGMCHERSDGTVDPLMGDLVKGGRAGLLAFLAVGAALLLWPRLRKAGTPGA